MGREVRRVPLNFDAPLNMVWTGFSNPHEHHPCPTCNGSGETSGMQRFCSIMNFLAESAKSAETETLYFWDHDNVLIPSKDISELTKSLMKRYAPDQSHSHYGVHRAIIRAAGMPEDWGTCPECKGLGDHPDESLNAEYNAWEAKEPPEGPAYQLWETVSAGSPISPPFAMPEELAEWLVQNDKSITRDTSYEEWLKFISGPGYAPSMVIINEGNPMSGVKASVATLEE